MLEGGSARTLELARTGLPEKPSKSAARRAVAGPSGPDAGGRGCRRMVKLASETPILQADLQARTFPLGEYGLPYFLGEGLEEFASDFLAGLEPSAILAIVDAGLCQGFWPKHRRAWSRVAPLHEYVVVPAEESKDPAQLAGLLSWAVGVRSDRGSVIVAVGGGVVGNLAGMLAHLLYRGVRLVHMPTTYMAAFDSVLSMKQAVNIDRVKNSAGVFHLPEAVICDATCFATLDPRDMKAGLAESVKNALIAAPEQIGFLENLRQDVRDFEFADHAAVWRASLDAKSRYLSTDAREKREALVFEYGHTAGHAIEAAARGRLRHGEAVSIGLLIAARVAEELGFLQQDAARLHEALLARFGLPLSLDSDLHPEEIEALLMRDNKRGYIPVRQDMIGMVLLEALGCPARTGEMPLISVPRELVMRVVREMQA